MLAPALPCAHALLGAKVPQTPSAHRAAGKRRDAVMLDSTKYPVASADGFSTSGSAPSLDAPGREAVAAKEAKEAIIWVRGTAWAEYHLLLGDSSPHSTRIEREIRTFGGAPTVAVLLARWCAEKDNSAHVRVQLSLALGRDPNARLLRRELESWASRLPNLRLSLQEDADAPEVAYRILMWPQHHASTCGAPQVLQCGEIDWRYEITAGHQTAEIAGDEALGEEVRQAALFWGLGRKNARNLAAAALRCWNAQPVLERVACDLSWREVEAEAARAEALALASSAEPRAG